MSVKYLDNAGTQYLVNKIKAIDGKIPTESQITTMITNALNTYKEGIVTIVESLPQTGEEGKLYLLIDPSDTDVYIVYTWEENAFKRMGSKTFTLTVDSALSSTSTNPVQNKVVKSALDGKANSSHTHGSITNDGKLATASRVVITGTDKKIGVSTVTTTQLGYLSGVTSAIQTQLDGKSPTGHTHTAGDVAGLATVATSGSYNDLSNKPTINNSTITIQKNGSLVGTFTVNGSAKTIDIPVPTKTSDLNNDSNFVDTSNPAVASGITSAKVTSYDSHVADTDIHVTTADKTKWNNGVSQAYVFRYSSTALVASSTNSNALLDNTDNLKVGDKVIDSDGVLFSITAIDTVNSTFTVGSALIDLALDGNVVHTSGNETIGGNKIFSNDIIRGSANTNSTIQARSLIGNTTASTAGSDSSAYQSITATLNYSDGTPSKSTTVSLYVTENAYADGRYSSFRPGSNNATNLGISGKRWANVYATNYYYGSSEVEFSTKFITTDTNQTVGGIKTFTDNISLKSLTAEYIVTGGGLSVTYSDKNGLLLAQNKLGNYQSGISYNKFSIFAYDSNNQLIDRTLVFASSSSTLATAYLRPDNDNIVSLGTLGNKWSKVYATNYYYGSNNVEFSTKFVTTDTAQEIGQNKTFTGVITINHAKGGILQLTCPDLDNTVDVTGNWATFMSFNSVDGGQTVASKGAVGLRQFKNGKNFALLLVEGTETLYFGSKSNSDSTKALYPANSGVCSLGTSTNKWATINGLEPSSLGMPDLSNGVDISSYITVNGGNKESLYTPPSNGWISVALTRTGGANMAVMLKQGSFASSGHNIAQENGTTTCSAMLPVKGGVQVSINSALADGINFAYFYPCQGNV